MDKIQTGVGRTIERKLGRIRWVNRGNDYLRGGMPIKILQQEIWEIDKEDGSILKYWEDVPEENE